MSTYTDLHNRLKENLTLLRRPGSKDDGLSPQKVILVNPENQFYGTFNGKMNITSGTLSGLKIIDSELNGVELAGATVDGVSLSEFTGQVDQNTQDIDSLQTSVEALQTSADAAAAQLSALPDTLSCLSTDVLLCSDAKLADTVAEFAGLPEKVDELGSKVETLSASMLNGVVYRGILTATQGVYNDVGSFFSKNPSCCLLQGTQKPLANGWMWRVAIDLQNVPGGYSQITDPETEQTRSVGEGDYIIVKNHDPEVFSVVPDNKMRLSDIDIINAQDVDDAKLAQLEAQSMQLCEEIKALSNQLCGDISSAHNLANWYTDGWIRELSGTTSSLVCATSSDVVKTAGELDSELNNVLTSKIADNLVSAKGYSNSLSNALSTTVDGKLKQLSDDLTSYTNEVSTSLCTELCANLSSAVDAKLDGCLVVAKEYSNGISTAISNVVNAEYVHLSGATIQKLSVEGELSTKGNLHVDGQASFLGSLELKHNLSENTGTHVKLADAGISLETYAGIDLSAKDNIALSAGKTLSGVASKLSGAFADGIELKTDDGLKSVKVNGEAIHTTLEKLSGALDAKKLDTALAKELSSQLLLTADYNKNLSTYENDAGYVISTDLSISYDSKAKKIKLTFKHGSQSHDLAEIDATEFVKDGMLDKAEYLPAGYADGATSVSEPCIKLTFNTDAGKEPLCIPVDKLVDIYTSKDGSGLSVDGNEFDIDYDTLKTRAGIDEISTSLYGSATQSDPTDPKKIGWLESLSQRIDAISVDEFGTLAFRGHLAPNLETPEYSSLSGFFNSCTGYDDAGHPAQVKNGAVFNIIFKNAAETNISAVAIHTDSATIHIGNGDVLVVHDHSDARFVDISSLAFNDSDESVGNVHLLKAGVSRYEFERDAKKLADDTGFISSWIISNFVNTKESSYSTTTQFKQDVLADAGLSVADQLSVGKDLIVASQLSTGDDLSVGEDLYANGSLFVASQKLRVESDSNDGIELAAKKMKLAAIGTQVDPDNNEEIDVGPSISITSTDVVIDARESIATNTKKFVLTVPSQTDTFSVVATSTCVDIYNNLMVDSTQVSAKSFSALSAQLSNACINKLSVDNFGQVNVAFSAVYDCWSTSSIAQLCTGLSTSISSLSDDLCSTTSSLCASIDNKVATGFYANGKYTVTSSDLSVIRISDEDYYQLVCDDEVDPHTVYIVSSDTLNAYDRKVTNVADPTDVKDGVNLKTLSAHTSNASNPHNVTASQLSVYLCAETSSKIELDDRFAEISSELSNAGYALCTDVSTIVDSVSSNLEKKINNKVMLGDWINNSYSGVSSDLSVIRISDEDYYNLVLNKSVDPSALYIVSSDVVNAHDKRVVNVATPTKDTDAVNYHFMRAQLSTALENAKTLTTLLSSNNATNLVDSGALNIKTIVSMLIEIKNVFASLSSNPF